MGTHGLFGFVYKGKIYLIYTHYDGYIDGLGFNLICEIKYAIKNGLIEQWIRQLESIKVVREGELLPTEEDIKKLEEWTGPPNCGHTTSEWYWLVHKCQGSFIRVLNSGYLLTVLNTDEENNVKNTITNSINMQSYVYILDLDRRKYIVIYEKSADEMANANDSSTAEVHFDIDNLPPTFFGGRIGILKYPGRAKTYRLDDDNELIYDD